MDDWGLFVVGRGLCRVDSSAALNLLNDKLGQYPYRLGKTLPRPMDEADITMEGVLPQVQRTHPGRPILMGRRLRHQRNTDAIFDQLDNGLQFVQLAHFTQGEMHLPQETIDLPAAER